MLIIGTAEGKSGAAGTHLQARRLLSGRADQNDGLIPIEWETDIQGRSSKGVGHWTDWVFYFEPSSCMRTYLNGYR